MQTVIEISKEDYEEVLQDTYSGTPFENRVFSAIKNSIPLEQIRDEIESHILDTNGLEFNSALYIASEIINNYIKEQTE